jgi:GNAT superfamily N-acetyltransferase
MGFTIAPASLDDAEIIVEHRRAMFYDMGHRDTAALERMAAAFRPWVVNKLRGGEYLAWFARSDDGTTAAGVGLWLMDWPPHWIDPGLRRGYILNVYTQPEHRRKGMARALVETAVEWCRCNGIIGVILHASSEGRGLYEGLGFQATNEMRRLL